MSSEFVDSFTKIQINAYRIAKEKGWWDNPNDGDKIAHMHAEVSEAYEALAVAPVPSRKIPGFFCVEEELADVVLQIMGLAEHKGLRIAEAIVAKNRFNETRPRRHGDKRLG